MSKLIHWFLERSLLAASPLFLAAVKGKAKRSVKPVKKKIVRRTAPAHRGRVKPVKRAPRPAPRKKESKPATPQKKVEPKLAGRPPVQTVPAEPLPKPVAPGGRALLLSPENGKFTDSVHPRFRWLSVGGATRYQVEWSDKPDFTESHASVSIATDAVVPVEKPLYIGGTYYWRVRGGNEGGWGPWSASASFRVLEETE